MQQTIFGLIKLALLLSILNNCNHIKSDHVFYVEHSNVDSLSNFHNLNNKIYKPGNIYTYEYKFKIPGKQGEFILCDTIDEFFPGRDSDIFIIANDSSCHSSFSKFEMKVTNKSEIGDNGELQTTFIYNFISKNEKYNASSRTGVVENHMNIWIHPIRLLYFEILEFSPFPFLSYMTLPGESYYFDLTVGEGWGDPRWYTFKGNIEVKSKYTIIGTKIIKNKFGEVLCTEVKAQSKSPAGISDCTFLFSEIYGLIKANYLLINGLQLDIVLVDANNI